MALVPQVPFEFEPWKTTSLCLLILQRGVKCRIVMPSANFAVCQHAHPPASTRTYPFSSAVIYTTAATDCLQIDDTGIKSIKLCNSTAQLHPHNRCHGRWSMMARFWPHPTYHQHHNNLTSQPHNARSQPLASSPRYRRSPHTGVA